MKAEQIEAATRNLELVNTELAYFQSMTFVNRAEMERLQELYREGSDHIKSLLELTRI